MLFGVAASKCLIRDYPGVSTHRRTVNHSKLVVDVHMRIKDSLLVTNAFQGDGYLGSLGQELGSMNDASYQELVGVILEWISAGVGQQAIGQSTILCPLPEDQGLYAFLSQTSIFRCLRYMLSMLYHLVVVF